MESQGIERKLRIAGILILLGLLIELGSLFRQNNPSSFVTFVFFGGTLIVLGILFYLYSLVAPSNKNQ